MARILVLGAGFAGLWSAVGAARVLDEFRIGRDEVEVTVVNRDGIVCAVAFTGNSRGDQWPASQR